MQRVPEASPLCQEYNSEGEILNIALVYLLIQLYISTNVFLGFKK